jgi:quinol-cytochrome oxidoreductase complex cytochrome b subunit
MIVLHPNTTQYNALNGYKHKSSELLFVKDGSDRWIVGLQVLSDPTLQRFTML